MTLFVGYAAYVFIPVDIIPATVSYFNDDIEPVVDIALEPPVIIDEIVLQTPQTDGSAEELVIIEPELEENLTDDLSPTLEQEVIIEPTPEVITQIQNEPEVIEETVPAFQVTATDEVQQVVEQWLQAWQQQDLNSYFSSYHESFEPISFSSLTTKCII